MSETDAVLYHKVVAVTNEYLGPAAERFITRQIRSHLNKEPSELTEADLAVLVDWIKVAIALLTEDAKTVDDFTNSLIQLAKVPVRKH